MLLHREQQVGERTGHVRADRFALHRRRIQRRGALVGGHGEVVRPEPHQPFDEVLLGGHRLPVAPAEFTQLQRREALAESHRRAAPATVLAVASSTPVAQVVVLLPQVIRTGRQRRAWHGGRIELRQQPCARIVDLRQRAGPCAQAEAVGGAGGFASDHRGIPWGDVPPNARPAPGLTGAPRGQRCRAGFISMNKTDQSARSCARKARPAGPGGVSLRHTARIGICA